MILLNCFALLFDALTWALESAMFNADPSNPDRVIFFFHNGFASTANLAFHTLKGVDVIATNSDGYQGTDFTVSLDTASAYNIFGRDGDMIRAGKRENMCFFVVAGTPDADKEMATRTQVGTILVTFAPNDTLQGSYAYVDGPRPAAA